jgi:tripartite motif-containing protein 2/3/tripartite motif-containing protein 71
MALRVHAIERLEEQLQCAVCLETYTDPKLLRCHHIFCEKCLKPLVREKQGLLVVPCPACRQETPIPANGVTGLPSAFYINQILEIRNTLQGWDGRERVDHCSVHDKELELYCETCEELVCSHCVFRGQAHHSHFYALVSESFEKYKAEISPSLAPLDDHLLTINKTLQSIDKNCVRIFDQREVIEQNIHDTIRQLHDVLEVRRTELIRQLHSIVEEKLKGISMHREQLEISQAQISSCLEVIRESLKVGSQNEVLETRGTMLKQVNELASSFRLDSGRHDIKADINFSAPLDTFVAFQNYGQVFTPACPDPSKCYVTSTGLSETVAVGEKSTFALQVMDFQGDPCEEPVRSLHCELVSDLTRVSVKGKVERKGLSRYKINYRPEIKGRHQLHIKVEGQHIRGSPFAVHATLPTKDLGKAVLAFGKVHSPWGMAVNHRGELLITECDKHCVSVYSSRGEKINSFGHRHGSELSSPRGITVDGEGNIIVSDYNNHCIQKFTADGQFLMEAGIKGEGKLQLEFSYPKNVAFNSVNKRLYVVDGTDCVKILNSDFTLHKTIGQYGWSKGRFNNPRGVACDSVGRVYVTDTWNKRVQVFTAEGKFLKTIGNPGKGANEVEGPADLTVDNQDVLYVSDIYNNRISVFDLSGEFVTSFGEGGMKTAQFKAPAGLVVDKNGVLYVCDREQNNVQLF